MERKDEKLEYEKPSIDDYGDLVELTQATLFFGTDDARAKQNPQNPQAFFS